MQCILLMKAANNGYECKRKEFSLPPTLRPYTPEYLLFAVWEPSVFKTGVVGLRSVEGSFSRVDGMTVQRAGGGGSSPTSRSLSFPFSTLHLLSSGSRTGMSACDSGWGVLSADRPFSSCSRILKVVCPEAEVG